MSDVVARGTWLYAGEVPLPVHVAALDHDYWYELGAADDMLEPGETPQPLGADGVLYYGWFLGPGQTRRAGSPHTSGYPDVDGARRALEARSPSPITWE